MTAFNIQSGVISLHCAAFGFFVLLLASLPAHACLTDKPLMQAAEGRLDVKTAQDAAGRPENPIILRLAKPACLASEDADMRVSSTIEIHVYSTRPGVHAKLKGLLGKSVSVQGQPFGAHTAHHHAPIVMDVSKVEPR